MRRAVIAIPILVLFSVALGFAVLWMYVHGTARAAVGEPLVEESAPGPFHAIDVAGLADITLVQGAAERVRLEVPARGRQRVTVEVLDGVLHVRHDDRRRWWDGMLGATSRAPKLRVTFRTLDAIEASGGLRLSAERLQTPELSISVSGAATLRIADLDTDRLRIEGSGAMKAELAGRARRQSVEISGAGDYRAAELVSAEADVDVSGAGRVVLRADETLAVSLSGAASVEYLGNPRLTESVSGVGRVKRREARDEPRPWIARSAGASVLTAAGPPRLAAPRV